MKTPEEIADRIEGEYAGGRDEVILGRSDFRAALIEAAREVQGQPATPTTSGDRYKAARKALAMHDAGKIKCYSDDPAERYDVQKMLAEALRALMGAAPTFKPKGEPDEFRDRWEIMRGAMHPEGATLRIETPGLLSIHTTVTPDQARRILEMLSSEDADQ